MRPLLVKTNWALAPRVVPARVDALALLAAQEGGCQIAVHAQEVELCEVQPQAVRLLRLEAVPAAVPVAPELEAVAHDGLDFAHEADDGLRRTVEPRTQVGLEVPAAVGHQELEQPEQLVAACCVVLLLHRVPPSRPAICLQSSSCRLAGQGWDEAAFRILGIMVAVAAG